MSWSKALPILLAALLLASILASTASTAAEEKVQVVVTAPVLKNLVEKIGGERVEVRSLLPPGVDPHSYEPDINTILSSVSHASLIVMTGPHHLPIEEKIEALSKEGVIKIPIINYRDYESAGLLILSIPETGAENPHGYFYTYSGLKAIAKACALKLSKIDPEGSDYYKQNLDKYLAEISALEARIRSMDVADTKIVLGGPVLQYVASDLDLKVVDMIILAHGLEPSSEDVAKAVNLIKRGDAGLVLISDREAADNPGVIKALESNGAPYAIVPVIALSDKPELIPLVTAALLKSGLQRSSAVGSAPSSDLVDAVLAPSLVANLVLITLVILLLIKVRRYGGSRS